jgi:hypothetical protein
LVLIPLMGARAITSALAALIALCGLALIAIRARGQDA